MVNGVVIFRNLRSFIGVSNPTKQKCRLDRNIEQLLVLNWKQRTEMEFQEHGNGKVGFAEIHLGAKNKYKRMNSELPEDHDDDVLHQEARRNRTRKYVIACAIFASLNNVLLGYGILYYSSI